MSSKKIMLVLGIRPDVIRASLIIRYLREELNNDFIFVWSGQHYSTNLKDIFFQELGVSSPEYELEINTGNEAEFIGKLIPGISKLIEAEEPALCCFLGDTNTVLGSLACAAMNIPIVHIEGCMRSYDWRMPEEKYRTVIDHLSDVIYSYLPNYKRQGIAEGLDERNIVVTGNPIVDVLEYYFQSGRIRLSDSESSNLLLSHGVERRRFALLTSHRRENVENIDALKAIMKLVGSIGLPVIFPASYRTQGCLKAFNVSVPPNVNVVDPIGYVEFLELLDSSRYVLTDSGTVVEEAAVLGVPSVQMRTSTERPEVYECGASIKFDPHTHHVDSVLPSVMSGIENLVGTSWSHGLGDGQASRTIVKDLIERLNGERGLRGHQPEGSGKPFERNWQ